MRRPLFRRTLTAIATIALAVTGLQVTGITAATAVSDPQDVLHIDSMLRDPGGGPAVAHLVGIVDGVPRADGTFGEYTSTCFVTGTGCVDFVGPAVCFEPIDARRAVVVVRTEVAGQPGVEVFQPFSFWHGPTGDQGVRFLPAAPAVVDGVPQAPDCGVDPGPTWQFLANDYLYENAAGADTAAGAWVDTRLTTRFRMTFETVTTAGRTSAVEGPTSSGMITPGFDVRLDTPVYQVATTATWSGDVTVCIDRYTDEPTDERNISWVFQSVAGGGWEALEPQWTGSTESCGTTNRLDGSFVLGKARAGYIPGWRYDTSVRVDEAGTSGGNGMSVTGVFRGVTTDGMLGFAPSTDAPAPGGFRTDDIAEPFWEVEATAVYAAALVCLRIGYPEIQSVPLQRRMLYHLFHWDGAGWTDVTTSRGTGQACGTVSSLGTFALGQPPYGVTRAGDDVTVSPLGSPTSDSDVSLRLNWVTAAGTTTSTRSASGPSLVGIAAPGAPAYYRLATTATLEGWTELCLPWDTSGTTLAEWQALAYDERPRVYEHDGTGWRRLPLNAYLGYGAACAQIVSLDSTFAVARPLPGGTTTGPQVPVTVPTDAGDVRIEFGQVTVGGITTVSVSDTGPTPSGFRFDGAEPVYFDLETTAEFTGSAWVCFPFDPTGMPEEQVWAQRLFHYADGAWHDITTSTTWGMVCGVTDSFSPFAIGSPVALLPFDTVPTPTIAGAVDVGVELAATPGAWSPTPDRISFQWSRDGVELSGATTARYTPVEADRGGRLTVAVTAERSGYLTATGVSAPVQVPLLRPLTATPTPTVSGTARVGSLLTAATGSWQPAPVQLALQWTRDGAPIAGATQVTYRLTADDLGASVAVRVSGSKSGFVPVERSSAGRVVAAGALTASPKPTITGTPVVGRTLTASAGAWAPAPVALAHQWLRNGTPIPGATGATYTLVAADVLTRISVRVTGSKAGYLPVTQTSTSTAAVAPGTLSGPNPTIAGVARVGGTLTAVTGVWSPAPVAFGYQWLRDGVAIRGATAATYRPVAADLGKRIGLLLVVTKPGYFSALRAAPATAKVVR